MKDPFFVFTLQYTEIIYHTEFFPVLLVLSFLATLKILLLLNPIQMRFLLFITLSLPLFLFSCTGSDKQPAQTQDTIVKVNDSTAPAETVISNNATEDNESSRGGEFFGDNTYPYNGKTENEIRENPRDIVDYYLIFPNPEGFEVKNTNETGNEFVARVRSLGPAEMITTVIDRPNAYLSILDETEGLASEMQMTSFSLTSGVKYIAARFHANGGDCSTEKFLVYGYENKTWKNLTSKVLPQLSMSDFCSPETLPAKELQQFEITFTLPQKGTTVKASIHAICEMDEFFQGKPGLMNTYIAAFNKASLKTIALYWNKTNGVFELTK
jgi:hypothetical protein